MRVKLTLTAFERATMLPLNYQHAVASMIYATLGQASTTFAARLHDTGFNTDGRNFKLFTFSRLTTARSRLVGDRLLLAEPTVYLQITSPVGEFVEHFVSGLFQCETFQIAGAQFRLAEAETLPAPVFTTHMRFRALSPITESVGEGQKHPRFLAPEDDWSEVIRQNLLRKHRALHASEPSDTNLCWAWDQAYLAAAARRGRRASALTDIRGIKVRGWLAPFTVEGSKELIELGYEAGFGSRNSMGFGMAEAIKS
jgi:CRISPR-associated endoribonuclease Cas6